MTDIYLIRHAEAEGNVFRRANGWVDGLVTAKGRRQIEALTERFRGTHIDALYASDLSRTMATAGAVSAACGLPIRPEPRLREIQMGSWEDRPWGNLSRDFPEMMNAFNNDPDNWHAPGAETFPELTERIKAAVLDLAARHVGQTIACVSHGMAIRALIAHLQGIASRDMSQCPHGDNTSVSLLKAENGELRVTYYNDASHLSPALSTFARQSWWRQTGSPDEANLVLEPLDPGAEPELYIRLYSETWRAVHGSLDGFVPEAYLPAAKEHFTANPEAIVKAVKKDRVVGVTELDTRRGEKEGYGWVCLCYITEEERRRQQGAQLLGHAVSLFRRLGRHSLRLNVFEGNSSAIAFYREYGFRPIGENEGVHGRLLLMEKDLSLS